MPKKIELTEKTSLLDSYIKKPRGMDDVPVLKAIKADVVKASSKAVHKASETDNALYNQCMGLYRQFLQQRNTLLDMNGKKAVFNSRAMKGMINYIRSVQKANKFPHGDAEVLKAMQFIFSNWSKLSEFHQKRILLPDIYNRIEEILSQIRNGHDSKSNANSTIEQRKQELAAKRQQRSH